jgi:MFS family permease
VILGLLAADIAFAFQETSIVPAIHDVQNSPGRLAGMVRVAGHRVPHRRHDRHPAMGRLADLHGRRRLLLMGLGVFLIGSVGAAGAPDMPVLLVCRAVQGSVDRCTR